MSKAYYYVKNFSFKEVNNLFAYSVKNPSQLDNYQKITRLYKGTLRKIMAMHFYTVKRVDYETFLEESRRARDDFESIRHSNDQRELDAMFAKYEQFIEDNFEPYAAMHECRPHSNLAGKMLLYSDEALLTDHVGWYSKNRLVTGEPSNMYTFHEEYPHAVTGWIYEDLYGNEDFDYSESIDGQTDTTDANTLKKQLDATK